ncbi:MAG: 50S ribosomal protein L25 [Candidatus Vogelbacteria bacterium]|nr:50S ribosomal protein L25 [Candidatus Vogelbacteria bacterium]
MTTNLNATKREVFGKELATERAAGQLPIVVYGAKEEAASYFVNIKDFKKVLAEAGESTIVTLETPAGKKDTLIHDIVHHPLTGETIHADFLVVEANKPIKVHVPLEFTGEAPAEKAGFMVVKVLHEIEVEALPKDLPHELIVDISTLVDLESRITVADVKLPVGVTTELELEEVLVSVTEAGEEVKEEEVPVDLSSIEVEEKGKKEDGSDSAEGASEE